MVSVITELCTQELADQTERSSRACIWGLLICARMYDAQSLQMPRKYSWFFSLLPQKKDAQRLIKPFQTLMRVSVTQEFANWSLWRYRLRFWISGLCDTDPRYIPTENQLVPSYWTVLETKWWIYEGPVTLWADTPGLGWDNKWLTSYDDVPKPHSSEASWPGPSGLWLPVTTQSYACRGSLPPLSLDRKLLARRDPDSFWFSWMFGPGSGVAQHQDLVL